MTEGSYGGSNKAVCPVCQRPIPGPKANKRLWGGTVVHDGKEITCPHPQCDARLVISDVHSERIFVLQYTLRPVKATPQQTYVNTCGRICPVCKSLKVSPLQSDLHENVVFHTTETPPQVTVPRYCRDCDHSWADTYTLTGYFDDTETDAAG